MENSTNKFLINTFFDVLLRLEKDGILTHNQVLLVHLDFAQAIKAKVEINKAKRHIEEVVGAPKGDLDA